MLKHRAGATVARITAGVRRNAFSYVLMLRLIPVTPLWLANLALGLVGLGRLGRMGPGRKGDDVVAHSPSPSSPLVDHSNTRARWP